MLPPPFLVAIFVLIFFMPWLNFCRHYPDICPADNVSYWQPRVVSLGMAGTTVMRSINRDAAIRLFVTHHPLERSYVRT